MHQSSIALARSGVDKAQVVGRPSTTRHLALIRAFDVIAALTALIFLLPLFVLIAIAIYACNPGPVIFAQKRLGYGGRHFRCFKFRSMAVDAEQRLATLLKTDPEARAEWGRDHKLKDDPRIVGIGRFLRKSSLDELPQLFNVLKGDMSLVGPRPIVDAEIIRYGRYFADYCRVRPGITGLWQISGRSSVSYRRRVALDVVYCRSASFALYLKILVFTPPGVLAVRGAY
jgi:exopolysaccharide production protein ExoY